MTDTTLGVAADDRAEPVVLRGGAHQHEVNRLLGAQAFLGGRSFRQKVLGFYRFREDATAPEHGLNVRLLVQTCLAAEREQMAFDRAFVASAVVCAVGAVEIWMLALGLLAAGAVCAGRQHLARSRAKAFLRTRFNFAACAQAFGRENVPGSIEAALPRNDQNVIVYSGFVPFVGAGSFQGSWSFNCALSAPREHGSSQGLRVFTTTALYSRIRSSMEAMNIPGLQCADKLFVNGCEVRGPEPLCEGGSLRPVQVLAAPGLAQSMEANDERIRHYLCVQVADWGGEVITTFFIRFVLRGNGLYVELNRFFLGPIADDYREVDKIADLTPWLRMTRAFGDVIAGPFHGIGACLAVAGRLQEALANLIGADRRRKARMKKITCKIGYDFGASSSLRELLSRPELRHYFQRSDEDFTRKLIERNVLDEIANFLEEHGFDSSDVRERRTTILNNGIIVNGGDVRSESLAVGAGATASKHVGSRAERAAA